jgi:hypothetical protein
MYREMPVLGDLYNILAKNNETKRLANIINRLVHGSASTFNQQTRTARKNVRLEYPLLQINSYRKSSV